MRVAPISPTGLGPELPAGCGPLSTAVCDTLAGSPQRLEHVGVAVGDVDPYGRDLQLALQLCYELHYRGFAGVDPGWEWEPSLLELRGRLERVFLEQVRRDVGPIEATVDVAAEMDALTVEPVRGSGLSWHLRDSGTWAQMCEYFVQRSVYHLKEGDPHAWVIPRLAGGAKAAFVAIEFDEYGAGRGPQVHQELYADLMVAAGLNGGYLAYLGAVSAEALAAVNLMSLFGLHRRWRGATVGHFAATEITSPPGSRRLVSALQRMDAPEECVTFYREHVEADAVHEQVVRGEVVADLVAREPQLAPDVVFGIRAYDLVESRLAEQMLTAWQADQSSLRSPLGPLFS
ncbi:iron-containing redox enzyme family protein [Mycolicibacillus trivialis]